MAFSVFISYSTNDLPSATSLCDWVLAAGAQPFLAEYSLAPGRPLASDIMTAIKSCDLFLLLWSASAKISEWVPQEIGIARGADKPIMPVVLEHGTELPGFIKDLKHLAVYRDPSGSVKWLYQHLVTQVKQKEANAMVAVGVIGAILLLVASGKKK